MSIKHIKLWIVMTALCASMAMGGPVLAAPDQFVCAAAEAIGCAQDEPCIRGSADRVALPLLWKVTLPEKVFVSISEGGQERSSTILEVVEGESSLVLFGVDGEMSWSAVIDTSDGKMTMTAATSDAGYIVHGACSTKIMK
jgi:hypothetical protein